MKDRPEGMDVAPRIDGGAVALHLLGAHVLERADESARRGERRFRCPLRYSPRDAEVDDFRLARLTNEDVSRLEIAVDDPLGVTVRDGIADLPEKRPQAVEVGGMFSHPVCDRRRTGHELHHDRRHRRADDLADADGEDLRDAWMIEAAEDLRFLGEATEQLVRPEPGPQHLHRHLARAVDGVPFIDAPHSPFAEHPRQAHAVELDADERIVAGLPWRRRAQLPKSLEIEAVDVGRVTLAGLAVDAWLVGPLLRCHVSAPRCYGRSPRKRV